MRARSAGSLASVGVVAACLGGCAAPGATPPPEVERSESRGALDRHRVEQATRSLCAAIAAERDASGWPESVALDAQGRPRVRFARFRNRSPFPIDEAQTRATIERVLREEAPVEVVRRDEEAGLLLHVIVAPEDPRLATRGGDSPPGLPHDSGVVLRLELLDPRGGTKPCVSISQPPSVPEPGS